jgi:hypothetical protein
MKLHMPKYPRFANLAWSVLALHVPAQNRNITPPLKESLSLSVQNPRFIALLKN